MANFGPLTVDKIWIFLAISKNLIANYVELKSVRQISGPPAIFMTSNVVAQLFCKYLGPHIVGRFE